MELTEYYNLIKALHIISFTAWMAGMFYLPRLFVYHADAKAGSESSEMLKIMERRLLRIIINPAMILTFVFGIALMLIAEPYRYGWFHAKLALVILMSALHGYLAICRKKLANDTNTKPAKFYRILNEVPTILLIMIVLLVVLKPF